MAILDEFGNNEVVNVGRFNVGYNLNSSFHAHEMKARSLSLCFTNITLAL